MRYNRPAFRVLAFLAAVTVVGACGGQEAAEMESAPAEAAAPPTPDSYTIMAKDGAWSADITPASIVFRHKRNDSLVFEFKEPSVTGAINEYESLLTGTDTVRLSISMAMTACTDAKGNQYTHIAQVWLTGDVQLQSQGCANKKM
jgi:hypothetical protein